MIRHAILHAADEQQYSHGAVAETEVEIQPDGVADNLPRETMMFVRIGRSEGVMASPSGFLWGINSI
jgi:hypothetical protein